MSYHECWHWTYGSWSRTLPGMTTLTASPQGQLSELLDGIRGAIAPRASWSDTAELVAEQLRLHLPGPDVLTPEQRLGSPETYRSHILHIEPDDAFSVIGLVWRPGQITRIHDHLTWCVFGVIQGIEHEELFDADLNLVGESDNHVGDISGFAPPGDIHRVHNTVRHDGDLDPRLRHGRHAHRLERAPLLRLSAEVVGELADAAARHAPPPPRGVPRAERALGLLGRRLEAPVVGGERLLQLRPQPGARAGDDALEAIADGEVVRVLVDRVVVAALDGGDEALPVLEQRAERGAVEEPG